MTNPLRPMRARDQDAPNGPAGAGLTLAATAMQAPPLGYDAIIVAALLLRVDFATNEGPYL